MFSGVKQHSADRLTMDSPNISKTTWSTTKSQTPFLVSRNSCKLSMHDTGNEKENYPMKPETSLNRSLTLTGLITSLAKVLPIPNRTTTTLDLPRAKAQLQNRRIPLLLIFSQTQERQKANSPGVTALSRQQALPLLWHLWTCCQGLSKIHLGLL